MVKAFLKRYLSLYFMKKKWRKNNRHNETTVGTIFDINKVRVGRGSYGHLYIYTWGASAELLTIGAYVSVGGNVNFILGGNHNTESISTFPFHSKKYGLNPELDASSKGEISIGDNTWIGMGSTILSGVKVGKGCIVAAGSVVTKSFPDYVVIGGNPAKLIKKRFSDEEIKLALSVDFSSIDIGDLSESQIASLYQRPSKDSVTSLS